MHLKNLSKSTSSDEFEFEIFVGETRPIEQFATDIALPIKTIEFIQVHSSTHYVDEKLEAHFSTGTLGRDTA